MKNIRVTRLNAGFRVSMLIALLMLASTIPSHAATLFGLINTGEIYKSVNDGASWSPHATLAVHDAVGIAARFTASDLFLVTGSGSVYRSLDAGSSWNPVGTITASDVVDFTIRPNGSLLALTATGAVYESADQGVSFTPLAALTGSNFRSLAFTRPAVRYYALTATGEVYESLDAAAWTPVGALPLSDARRIRSLNNTLFVMSEAGDIYSSTDRGVSWTPVGTLSQVGMRGLVDNSGALVAATREGHVAASANGASWTWQGSINQLELMALASDAPATTSVDGTTPRPGFELAPPFPNPSTGEATFVVRLERDSEVRLALYDLGGRQVAARAPEFLPAGTHPLKWEPVVPSAGVYFARASSDLGAITRRWLIIK